MDDNQVCADDKRVHRGGGWGFGACIFLTVVAICERGCVHFRVFLINYSNLFKERNKNNLSFEAEIPQKVRTSTSKEQLLHSLFENILTRIDLPKNKFSINLWVTMRVRVKNRGFCGRAGGRGPSLSPTFKLTSKTSL